MVASPGRGWYPATGEFSPTRGGDHGAAGDRPVQDLHQLLPDDWLNQGG